MTATDKEMTLRYLQFVDYFKMSDKRFAEEIGVSMTTINKIRQLKEPIRGITLMRTMKKYPILSGNWVVNGDGEMLVEHQKDRDRFTLLQDKLKLAEEQVAFYKEKIAFLEKNKKK